MKHFAENVWIILKLQYYFAFKLHRFPYTLTFLFLFCVAENGGLTAFDSPTKFAQTFFELISWATFVGFVLTALFFANALKEGPPDYSSPTMTSAIAYARSQPKNPLPPTPTDADAPPEP